MYGKHSVLRCRAQTELDVVISFVWTEPVAQVYPVMQGSMDKEALYTQASQL